jgi:hypothetical protein
MAFSSDQRSMMKFFYAKRRKGAELSLLALGLSMDPLLQNVSEEFTPQRLRAFLFLPTVIILPFVP